MKKWILGVLAAALTLGGLVTTVSAAGRNGCGLGQGDCSGTYCAYVDEDQNGVCDRQGTFCSEDGCRGDLDADGICDRCGAAWGEDGCQGDRNGDGVRDYAGNGCAYARGRQSAGLSEGCHGGRQGHHR